MKKKYDQNKNPLIVKWVFIEFTPKKSMHLKALTLHLVECNESFI